VDRPYVSQKKGPQLSCDVYVCDVKRQLCCFVLLNRYLGIVTVPGFPRANRPQIITWGGRILTLHLNYVAVYSDSLLFLFERTQQLTPLTTRGKPWRLRVWACPKFVRPHRWGPWVMKKIPWILGSPRTAKSFTSHDRANHSNTGLFFEKRREKENPKERDPPQRSQGHTDSFSHLRAT